MKYQMKNLKNKLQVHVNSRSWVQIQYITGKLYGKVNCGLQQSISKIRRQVLNNIKDELDNEKS